ncbi:MAG: c-type cytochrome [Siphonobacter sp.]
MQRAILSSLYCIAMLTACQPGGQKKDSSMLDSARVSQVAVTYSASIDLIRWKVKMGKTERITIKKDPVFHKTKSFDAVPLENVLKEIPGYKAAKPEATQVVFECEDGYNPSMPLSKVLAAKVYLAVHDADATPGEDWTTLKKGPETKKIAPFYVCYTDVSGDDPTYKWPYNLVKISLTATSKETAALFPKEDDSVVKGYGLFKTYCLTCHALNGVGGRLGPELNSPKSVTEYWKLEDIKAFVANPSAYRNNVKMPQLGLKTKEIDEIVGYLSYMARHR